MKPQPDRLATRELETSTRSAWRDAKIHRDRLPREIRIHELLEERRAVDSVILATLSDCARISTSQAIEKVIYT
ncbi:unnamed protein product [Alternaria burnsii]|nr:unnamed protein product [Alternaria burnsii]